MTKLIIFDLDGTLAESKQPLTSDMSALVAKLLEQMPVAIISGGALSQFLKQVIAKLPVETNLSRLYLLPTSGAALYEFQNDDWKKIYEERLSEKDKEIIETAMQRAAEETKIINFSNKSWGERIEYRGGQVSLSALGQQAPIALKKEWDPTHSKRRTLAAAIQRLLPSRFTALIGGMTTIDVTKAGVDKAYGIHQLCERLKIEESDALYAGDELGPGGNDETVYKTNVETKRVASPAETEQFIKTVLTSGT